MGNSKLNKVTYGLDDVGIVQAPISYTEHRKDVNPFIEVCGREMYPIFASPMESVVDEKNYKIFIENKITPVIPRTVQQRLNIIERLLLSKETFVSFSLQEVKNLFEQNTFDDISSKMYICIDMAHGTLNSLYETLTKGNLTYEIENHPLNIKGEAEAELVGGNISVLYSLLASSSFPNTDGKILFLEDLDEYLYHIDRMMMALKRAGKFDNIKGLIVGGLTKMHDNAIQFGKTAEQIIFEYVKDKNIPVCFNFPAGHIDDNRALVFGKTTKLKVSESECSVSS